MGGEQSLRDEAVEGGTAMNHDDTVARKGRQTRSLSLLRMPGDVCVSVGACGRDEGGGVARWREARVMSREDKCH